MLACMEGHVDISRMLLGDFHANIDIQNTVRAIVRLFCVAMCEHVFSGCARGGGGWDCGRCRGYWHIFGFHIVTIVCIIFFIIAPLHWGVNDVL